MPPFQAPVHVGDPLAVVGGRQHLGPEVVAFDVGVHPALHVEAQAVGVGVPDDQIVLVDDEDVPLAVDALLAAVVGEGGVQAVGPIAADCVVDEELGGPEETVLQTFRWEVPL